MIIGGISMLQLRIIMLKMEKENFKLSKWFHAPKNIGVLTLILSKIMNK